MHSAAISILFHFYVSDVQYHCGDLNCDWKKSPDHDSDFMKML